MNPTPEPTFKLTQEQMTAVLLIEQQIHQLRAAAFVLSGKNLRLPDAAGLLEGAALALDEGRGRWLASTQSRVQVASVIPDLAVVRP